MSEKIGEALRARLQSAQEHDTFEVDIFMEGEPAEAVAPFADGDGEANDNARAAADPAAVAERFQELAASRQHDVLGYLTSFAGEADFIADRVSVPKVSAVRSFWINNAVSAEVTLDVLTSLLERPDVIHIDLTRRADVSELIDAKAKPPGGAKKAGARNGGGAAKARGATKRRGAAAGSSSDAKVRTAAGAKKGRAARAAEFDVLDFVRSGVTFAEFAGDGLADSAQPTWSVNRVNAPLLWQQGLSGEGVVVAVIDTGVNYDHPDLRNRMWDGGPAFPKHGEDFATGDKDPRDEGTLGIGHGTACAGIVAGDGTSGRRTGVAPGARVMALRVGGDQHHFWRAFQFAIQQRVQVISMSMTWKNDKGPDYPNWRRICASILAAGILHANSIGNEGQASASGNLKVPFNIGAPGNCPPPRLHPLQVNPGGGNANISSPVSCGATDEADRLLAKSGRGPSAWETPPFTDFPFANGARPGLTKPDVCAPGAFTDTCNWRFRESGKPYTSFDGTSSATPHVAGCMALLAQACLRTRRPIVPARVQEALENTAVRIHGQVRDKEINFGAGRVDVFAAFRYGAARGWWG